MKTRRGHSVSGPSRERDGFDTAAVGLSAAITYATKHGGPCTFYVRDEAGTTVGRVERADDGTLRILGPSQLAAIREEESARAFVPGR